MHAHAAGRLGGERDEGRRGGGLGCPEGCLGHRTRRPNRAFGSAFAAPASYSGQARARQWFGLRQIMELGFVRVWVLAGSSGQRQLRFWATVARVMWPLRMAPLQVIGRLPDGPVGPAGVPTGELLAAYQEAWRVMELLRLIVGSPHWWDSAFSGSVASTLSLRDRLIFSDAEEALVWVGGDANMNGVAAGSWTDGVYAIVKTEDWEPLLREILTDDLMPEGGEEGTVIVAIWEFLCIIMIATFCAARWTDKIAVYVSDNQPVMRWITNLRAQCKIGNYFYGLLTLLQARFHFEMYCVYINTKPTFGTSLPACLTATIFEGVRDLANSALT